MSISSAVVRLANLVAAERAPLAPSEMRLHACLVAMPKLLEQRNLGEWEARIRDATAASGRDGLPGDGSSTWLLERVADLGTFNLYGAFDVVKTTAEYEAVIADLSRFLGVGVGGGDDLSDW